MFSRSPAPFIINKTDEGYQILSYFITTYGEKYKFGSKFYKTEEQAINELKKLFDSS